MNINQTLFDNCSMFSYKYGFDQNGLKEFMLNAPSRIEKQKKALKLIESIVQKHNKKPLLTYLLKLPAIEYGISESQEWVRDHFVHALKTFFLGIFIYENYLKAIINDYHEQNFIFEWKLAALFHDIGYPLQIANDIFQEYIKDYNKLKTISNIVHIDPNVKIDIKTILNIGKLHNERTCFQLISGRLKKWKLHIKSKKVFDMMINNNQICHGIISALIILHITNIIYQQNNPDKIESYFPIENNNWDYTNFKNDIVNACTAIFLHNLSGDFFSKKKIEPKLTPIAFLLKLADSLQEWERPSFNDKYGLSPEYFDIQLEGNILLFFATIPETKNKIAKSIKALSLDNFELK